MNFSRVGEHGCLVIIAVLLVIGSFAPAAAGAGSPTKSAGATLQLAVRRYPMAAAEPSRSDEAGSGESDHAVTLDLSRTALLLIDVWKMRERRPDDGWLDAKQANIEQKIVPLLAFARQHGLRIIHLPHRQEIADEAAPLPGEIVCDPPDPADSQQALLTVLREHQITTLLYAGYTSNLCVLHRPVGILAMRSLGYQTILIRDCTVPFVPKHATSEDERARLKAVEPFWEITTTLDDLRQAVRTSGENVAQN